MVLRWQSLLFGALPATVLAGGVLQTTGYSTCGGDGSISVQKMDIQYDQDGNSVVFDVAGTSTKQQNVTGVITVYAYGNQVYTKSFDPCDSGTFVQQLCPVPVGSFSAQGTQAIPNQFASQIPSIAFNIPDLDGTAKLQLLSDGSDIACIESTVSNGKSFQTPAVPAIAAAICGGALAVSGLTALLSGGSTGAAPSSPTFFETFTWFQGIAMNGMLSVSYPGAYRSFASNFAFSTGLIPWGSMQTAIDSFRARTGGNLTDDSYAYLRNSTIVFQSDTNVTKRGLDFVDLVARAFTGSENGTTFGSGSTANSSSSGNSSKSMHLVNGIEGYVEQLAIPQANTFMTVLLFFAIVIGAIIVGILLIKVILEAFSMCGKLGKTLNNFRKRYWWIMAKTITNLILLLYGVWTLYCVYQFTRGDSWAAKVLAGVTLGIFTAILAFFTIRIYHLAHKYRKTEGDVSGLFDNKEIWRNYSIFYENYKKSYWWLFVPVIVYMFAKGVVIAAGDGHGMFQTAGQLIIESLMLVLLLFLRPFSLKSGNWINIIIQIVRVLSVVCILVFVEQLGIAQTPKTVVGVILIVVQSVLTGLLAILILVNACVVWFRANPHRRARKEAGMSQSTSPTQCSSLLTKSIEKLNRDLDNLTPLDARNSLLMPTNSPPDPYKRSPLRHEEDNNSDENVPVPYHDNETGYNRNNGYSDNISLATRSLHNARAPSPNPSMRAPLLPQVDMGYRSRGY
jgi:hypothetical protein